MTDTSDLCKRLRDAALATPVRFPIKRLAVLAAVVLEAKDAEIAYLEQQREIADLREKLAWRDESDMAIAHCQGDNNVSMHPIDKHCPLCPGYQVTDEMVEAASEAFCISRYGTNVWSWIKTDLKQLQIDMRAALEAALTRPRRTAMTDSLEVNDMSLQKRIHSHMRGPVDPDTSDALLLECLAEIKRQRFAALHLWADWASEGWDRPDYDIRSAFEFSDAEQRAALNTIEDNGQDARGCANYIDDTDFAAAVETKLIAGAPQ